MYIFPSNSAHEYHIVLCQSGSDGFIPFIVFATASAPWQGRKKPETFDRPGTISSLPTGC